MHPLEPRIPFELLDCLFSYDPETGVLSRKVSRGPCKAGTVIVDDYIKIGGWQYVTARVIWCLHYGDWPPTNRLVDHKDRNRDNNTIANLRLATYAQNAHNRAGRGFYPKGTYDSDNSSFPWAARIMVHGQVIELGIYKTVEEAAEAYRVAALKHHGEFACLD